ncbi:MAG: hypothetical protein LBQ12_02910 [Deltaproteobacteria bacterium]|nr:hypothetical protein [Deltaproteobacteria bacterium]
MGSCVFPELSPAEISILQIIHLVTGTSREQPEREFLPIRYPDNLNASFKVEGEVQYFAASLTVAAVFNSGMRSSRSDDSKTIDCASLNVFAKTPVPTPHGLACPLIISEPIFNRIGNGGTVSSSRIKRIILSPTRLFAVIYYMEKGMQNCRYAEVREYKLTGSGLVSVDKESFKPKP